MKLLTCLFAFAVTAGLSLEAEPDADLSIVVETPSGATLQEPEPLACYGVAPACNYPKVQCCIDNAWSCCRKGF